MKVSIPNPCHEDWHKMTPTQKGRFCHSCDKEVEDLTHLSRIELGKYLATHDLKCVKFRTRHIDVDLEEAKGGFTSGRKLVAAAAASLMWNVSIAQNDTVEDVSHVNLLEQTILREKEVEVVPTSLTDTIRGVVLDSATNSPIPFANVILSNNGVMVTGVTTDFDGKFAITYNQAEGDSLVLQVSSMGFANQTVPIYLIKNEMNVILFEVPLGEANMTMGMVLIYKPNIWQRITGPFKRAWNSIFHNY